MGNKSRVITFISNLSASNKDVRTTNTVPASQLQQKSEEPRVPSSVTATESSPDLSLSKMSISQQKPQQDHALSRSKPVPMLPVDQSTTVDSDLNTPPELQPIFALLNDHANKLYQEGYFLKLDDQNTQGKPNSDRVWTECFAQLVGTVLSLWDANELDLAGQEREVVPKFINLSDASIKMIDSLPTRSETDAPLQNVLSISTAGKNRYLLHFNSHHSLIQWTAGIRLAMYEHATFQEVYTGALIAGKGKSLNNINSIMGRSRSSSADWARVRFGAGTPWRRCWCVISPADEKELIKSQKQSKRSPYDRSKRPILKGVVKFYHSKKTKKVQPIATISDAYSAFAIYPQSKPLINVSTLVKVEGSIIIHSNPPSTTEGFVFVMPEVHPGVTGFEMMLRWLIPVFDTFALYGRPGRLVAATEDVRSLMFAMPRRRRFGYLEILDVVGLLLEEESSTWKESQWRKRMKELTASRMMAIESDSRTESRLGGRRGGGRGSTGPANFRGLRFDADGDDASVKSSQSTIWAASKLKIWGNHGGYRSRTDSAPPISNLRLPTQNSNLHNRSISETYALDHSQVGTPPSTRGRGADENGSVHQASLSSSTIRQRSELESTPERLSSEDELNVHPIPPCELQELKPNTSLEPVTAPPAFVHGPGSLPVSKPYHSPELRRASNRISCATLDQLNNHSKDISQGRDIKVNLEQVIVKPNIAADGEKFSSHNKDGNHTTKPHQIDSAATTKQMKEKVATIRLINSVGDISISKSKLSDPCSNTPEISSYPFPPPSRDLPPIPSKMPRNSSDVAEQFPKVESTSRSTSTLTSQQTNDSTRHNHKEPDINIPSLEKVGSNLVRPKGHFINEDIFDKISYESSQLTAEDIKNNQNNKDTPEAKTSDHSVSKSSVDISRDLDRPRAGVMRTVGDKLNGASEKSNIISAFDIDFGPTFNFATIKSPSLSKSSTGSSFFTTNPYENSLQLENQSKTSNERENSKSNTVKKSRTVAWNPTYANSVNSAAQHKGLTPEDFVAQRANTTPMYVHQRISSADVLRNGTSTPPHSSGGTRLSEKSNYAIHSRNCSSDKLSLKNHYRNCSGELLQRPISRGALRTLGLSDHARNYSTDQSPRTIHVQSSSVDQIQRLSSRTASITLNSTNIGNNNNSYQHAAREKTQLGNLSGQTSPVTRSTNRKDMASAEYISPAEAFGKDKLAIMYEPGTSSTGQITSQQYQILDQKVKYPLTATKPRPKISAPNPLMQSGGGWNPAGSSSIFNFKHGRSFSSFSFAEYYSQARHPVRESIK